MFRHGIVLLILLVSAGAGRASAQHLSVAFGPHVVRQDDASHAGGAVAGTWRRGRVSFALELGQTRRAGHNDWRALAGPRVALATGSRAEWFAHAMAGALIRSSVGRSGWLAGTGVDLHAGSRVSVRLQLDAVSTTDGRASAWLVLR